MHHFLALRPDGATRDRLAAVADRLRAWDLPASWTHPDDYHLTVRFLGDLSTEDADFIPAAIDDVANSAQRPVLRLAGLGATGARGSGIQTTPRAVFAAVEDLQHVCEGLHRDLGDCLEETSRSPFVPHLTLCRPQPTPQRGPLFRDWPHLLEAHGLADWGPCTVDALVLYCSTGAQPRYHALAVWGLA
jgi:2'-5' RNA ligase